MRVPVAGVRLGPQSGPGGLAMKGLSVVWWHFAQYLGMARNYLEQRHGGSRRLATPLLPLRSLSFHVYYYNIQ
jgi:hypothetical protein